VSQHLLIWRTRAAAGIVTLAATTLLPGCIAHRLTVRAPDDCTVIVDAGRGSAPVQARGALPQARRVTVWRRTADGALARADTTIATALPWWQRFPADLVSDLLPWTWTVTADKELLVRPIPVLSEHELTFRAATHGYAAVPPSPSTDEE
jgi:hypothetical protein